MHAIPADLVQLDHAAVGIALVRLLLTPDHALVTGPRALVAGR